VEFLLEIGKAELNWLVAVQAGWQAADEGGGHSKPFLSA